MGDLTTERVRDLQRAPAFAADGLDRGGIVRLIHDLASALLEAMGVNAHLAACNDRLCVPGLAEEQIAGVRAELLEARAKVERAKLSCRHCGQEKGCKPDCAVTHLVAEVERMQEDLDAHAFEVSRPMLMAKIDQLNAQVDTEAAGYHATILELSTIIERQKRILAVERGDESQAPEGWARTMTSENNEWIDEKWERLGATVWRGLRSPCDGWEWQWYWAVGVTEGTATPTALEAMEAADAALEADDA